MDIIMVLFYLFGMKKKKTSAGQMKPLRWRIKSVLIVLIFVLFIFSILKCFFLSAEGVLPPESALKIFFPENLR